MTSSPDAPGRFAFDRAGWALLPLRLFLGVTFTFAGIQKLANPGFFKASNPASIQAQMAAAAKLSPVHALVSHLQPDAVAIGVVIALGEIAIGIGTLLGLLARAAAVAGIVLSLTLFLTVSFHSTPYYTGSDIVFVFAWMPMILAGAGGVLSLDAWISEASRRRPGDAVPAALTTLGNATDRRTFTGRLGIGAVAAGAGLVLGGLAAGLGRLASGSGPDQSASKTLTLKRPVGGAPGSTPTTRGSGGSGGDGKPPGRPVGLASGVPVGGSAAFNDPATGDTSLVIQPVQGRFLAFDAICPHEGCTVQYFHSQGEFICPCHGSRFNASTGAVLQGPASTGLTSIRIAEGPDGELYAV